MEFPYYKVTYFPKHQKFNKLLPWIRVGLFNLSNPCKIVNVLGLVDSGAEITFVDHEIGEFLGLDFKKTKKDKVYGVGGGSISIRYKQVGLCIEDTVRESKFIYQDFVGFADKPFPLSMPQQTAIFGTIGFFRHLEVTFRYPTSIFINPLSNGNPKTICMPS